SPPTVLPTSPSSRSGRGATGRRCSGGWPSTCPPRRASSSRRSRRPSPTSRSTATAPPSSLDRATMPARGSGTGPSPPPRCSRWGSRPRCATSCAGTRATRAPTARCRAVSTGPAPTASPATTPRGRTAKLAALRDSFGEALYASIGRAMAQHGIDFLPGSAELGDFDPTSTSIALAPGGELGHLPEPALKRTFERYWEELVARRRGDTDSDGYSPYEVRNVDAFVRLGEKQRALDLLDQLLADQRPRGWNEWAEIVWPDRDAPRLIGDMPPTWVGSPVVRSVP